MARSSPLADFHRRGNALLAPYGPDDQPQSAVSLVQAFDPVQIEYAAVRTAAAVFDQPHRATLIVTGADRIEFLNRMLTQELKGKGADKGLEPGTSRRSFWLNRKGRIDADLRVLNLGDRIVLDADVHAAERCRTGLEAYIITEDCAIADETERWHRLSLHGPGAAALLAHVSHPHPHDGLPPRPIADIQPGQIAVIQIAGTEVVADRWDWAGEIGLELLVPVESAAAVYEAISAPWPDRTEMTREGGGVAPSADLARRIGWHALNIARIETGTALYYADFGPSSLPHECGAQTLRDRVSFTKGCYLGQEVVARMQSLGHPKQRLVGLRIAAGAEGAPQAGTGAHVLEADAAGAPVVGAVTSSCISPMLGSAPIAFAMVKWSHAQEGKQVWLDVEGTRVGATVRESLAFWNRG